MPSQAGKWIASLRSQLTRLNIHPSREQPVHEPVGGHCPALLVFQLALIEAVAEDPEAQAFGILDTEIIARQRLAVLAPPFHGDALGSLDPHHRMQRAPPGEL